MLEEALFIGLLVDNKGVIHILALELGGGMQCLGLFCSKDSMYRFTTMELTGEPMATPSTCSKNWPWKEK